MDTILKKISSTADKYVLVLSQILRVNVEIIDEDCVVISSSEKGSSYQKNEAHIYKAVLASGEKRIITSPREDESCRACSRRACCTETLEMHTPVRLSDRVIGVICFSCSDEEQRSHIMDNFDTLIEFIDQISDLISLKAKEALEAEQTGNLLNVLKTIIDKVEQGVVITGADGIILRANDMAARLLRLSAAVIETGSEKIVIREGVNLNEYQVQIAGRRLTLTGELHQLRDINHEYQSVFMFSDPEKLLRLANARENIGLQNILGRSQKILQLKEQVKKVAASTSTVLITGPSGTGKELFARSIHAESGRRNGPFVAINCAAIPDTLLESELFGYVKGAFTGADPKGKTGKVELANGGVLFLDEIGDMPLYIQAKVLRVLEQQEIVRLGAGSPVYVDVRFIAATNKDLKRMIEERKFREDLYYRLHVIPFEIPALKERKEDILLLTDYFVKKYAALFQKTVDGVSDSVWACLYRYDWPGNVRELENTVEYMINMLENDGRLTESLLPDSILEAVRENVPVSCFWAKPKPEREGGRAAAAAAPAAALSDSGPPVSALHFGYFQPKTVEDAEKQLIADALREYGQSYADKQRAAEALGMGVATLYRKIKKYGLKG